MSGPRQTDASRPSLRRQGYVVVGRVLLTILILVVVYYTLPFDQELTASLAVLLVGALALVGALGFVEVRAILDSPFPRLKAIEALTTLLPLLWIIFASTFYVMSEADPSNFSEPLTRTDALYLVVTVFSTVGFGDITPDSQTARALVTAQIVVNLVVVGLGLRVVLGAAEHGHASGASSSPTEPTQT